ncbi:MAG: hypothetical protein IT287_03845 [Bdellovibrionaceae bacterium]|nr:hypothetical protein [Pseudobdellovibrionaceae bacterium]
MKIFISVIVSLLSSHAFALTLNDGTFISENCGKVEVSRFRNHPKYLDGDVRIDYAIANNEAEDGFVEVGYSIYSSDFFEIKKVSGLCMDAEINLRPLLWRLSPTELHISCGSSKTQVNDTLFVEADATGELTSLDFISKVAKFSLSNSVFIPFLQKIKVQLECTNFVRVK